MLIINSDWSVKKIKNNMKGKEQEVVWNTVFKTIIKCKFMLMKQPLWPLLQSKYPLWSSKVLMIREKKGISWWNIGNTSWDTLNGVVISTLISQKEVGSSSPAGYAPVTQL